MEPSMGHLPPSLGFYSGDWLLSLIIYKRFCGEFFCVLFAAVLPVLYLFLIVCGDLITVPGWLL